MHAAAGTSGGGGSGRKPLNVVLKELLKKFRRKDRSHIFWDPVPKSTPGYYEAIKTPMDFSLMEAKMKKNKYSTLDDFLSDYILIITNCKYFNNAESEYWEMADMMEKYGREVVEAARESIDMSVPPNAKWNPGGTATTTTYSTPAASSAADHYHPSTPSANMYHAQASDYAAAAAAAAASSLHPPRAGARGTSIAQASQWFEPSMYTPQNLHNPHLYPTIPPGYITSHAFVHPGSLPESANYWVPSSSLPYLSSHPLSESGKQQAALALNTSTQTNTPSTKFSKRGGGGRQMYTQIGRPKRDIRLFTGPGVTNNIGLGMYPTSMDWVTTWEREQEVWKQTGKNAMNREEHDCHQSLGPLHYNEYRPSTQMNFDTRYIERISKFMRQGLIGDAAAIPKQEEIGAAASASVASSSSSSTTPASSLLLGATSSIYSHLLKESSVYKHLSQKIETLQVDPNLIVKPTAKDYIPSPAVSNLPKQYIMQLKSGEPMGVALQDIMYMKSLMSEVENMMKSAISLRQSQVAQANEKKAGPIPDSTSSSAAAAAASSSNDTSAPMDVDSSGVKSEQQLVKNEPGTITVKTELGLDQQIKQEPGVHHVKSESGDAMDTSDGSSSVKLEHGIVSAALARPAPWTPPNLVALLPVLPTTRIVDLDINFSSPATGSIDTRVRFRFSAPTLVATDISNFTPEFLAKNITQFDITALRGVQAMTEKMMEWQRVKHQQIRAQQAKQQQQQQMQQQQQAAAAAAAASSGASSVATSKHGATPLPTADEQANKRVKLEQPSPSTAPVPPAATPNMSAAQQQAMYMKMQAAHLQQQQAQAAQQNRGGVAGAASTSPARPPGATSLPPNMTQEQWQQIQVLKQQQAAAGMSNPAALPVVPPSAVVTAPPAHLQQPSHPPPSSAASPSLQSTPPPHLLTGTGPSSQPLFDRTRLMPALRSLNAPTLDKLITLGFISATGTVLVDTGIIITKLREMQAAQQRTQGAGMSPQVTQPTPPESLQAPTQQQPH